MLYHAHVEHAQARPEQSGATPGLPESGFFLTDPGERFAESLLPTVLAAAEPGLRGAARDHLVLGTLVPHFDKDTRLFTWGSHVLKAFRQPSENQVLVLCAAEELGWPEWFDDPLPRRAGRNPKTLLHDTIKDLNRRQHPYLIHFKGDGTGTRVGWEYRCEDFGTHPATAGIGRATLSREQLVRAGTLLAARPGPPLG
jgi:hypothetical protein